MLMVHSPISLASDVGVASLVEVIVDPAAHPASTEVRWLFLASASDLDWKVAVQLDV